MQKIVEFLKITGEEYPAKVITTRLRMKLNTVRTYLPKLVKAKIIEVRKVDGFNFYKHPIPVPAVPHELPELKFHDINLRFHHQGKQFCGFPGWWKKTLFVKDALSGDISSNPHKVVSTAGGQQMGEVSFQQGRENLMVYYGGSGRPLNWAELMGFCRWLGRTFRCDVFTDERWYAVQIGPGTDFGKMFFESFGGSVAVHDFLGNIARVYNKQLDSGEEVVRAEFHTAPNMTLGAMVEALRGGLSFGDTMNLVASQTKALEEVPVWVQKVSRKVDTLVSILHPLVEKLDQVLERIR